jgi:hypothetical protein
MIINTAIIYCKPKVDKANQPKSWHHHITIIMNENEAFLCNRIRKIRLMLKDSVKLYDFEEPIIADYTLLKKIKYLNMTLANETEMDLLFRDGEH